MSDRGHLTERRFGRVRLIWWWNFRRWKLGPWPHSPAYFFIFDLGPLRVAWKKGTAWIADI